MKTDRVMDNFTTSDITRYSTPVYISVNKEPVHIVEIRPTGGVTFSWSKTKKKPNNITE